MNLVCLCGQLVKPIDLFNVSENKTLGKFNLHVITGEEVEVIECICWDKIAFYIHQNARKDFDISITGQVRTIKEKSVNGLPYRKMVILVLNATIHTPRYDNALTIDEFITRYAPKNILKKMEKTQQTKVEETIPTDDQIQIVFKDVE